MSNPLKVASLSKKVNFCTYSKVKKPTLTTCTSCGTQHSKKTMQFNLLIIYIDYSRAATLVINFGSQYSFNTLVRIPQQ